MSQTLRHLFNLRRDQDAPDAIDADIRAGSEPVGANLWVLFFAILIASVGLNVNSTAVIIGAMLVSPLMGPIQAIGYGTAVRDLKLIREGARTLLIFTALSLVTSTLYFALSPLAQPGSELLARTSPTLWDVLIAAFGGAAGMVAATRKDVSNVVPGVAIATALMPPLCTVGFGLAHARWDMVGGATYLFVINGVFIAAGTLTISRVLRLPLRGTVEPKQRARHRLAIGLGMVLVLAPSVWLGYRFVQHEIFKIAALRVADLMQQDPTVNIVAQQVDADRRVLRLTLVGSFDEARVQALAASLFAGERAQAARVELRRAGDAPVDVASLRTQLKQDMDSTLLQQLRATEARLQRLDGAVAALAASAASAAPGPASMLPQAADSAALAAEVQAQLPQVKALTLARGARTETGASGAVNAPTFVVVVERGAPLTAAQQVTLAHWLSVRLGNEPVLLQERPAPGARDRR